MLAIILSTVLVAAGIAGVTGERILSTQETGGDPVPVSEQNVAFSSGDNVVIDDPAIATQGLGPGQGQGTSERTVKEFSTEEPFSMFALTWEGDLDVASFVRAQAEDGSWGQWYSAEPIGETSPSGKNGTDLIYVEPTTKIQVSTTGIDYLGAEAAGTEGTPAEESPATDGAAAPAAETPTEPASAPQSAEEPAVEAPAPAEAPTAEVPADTPAADTDSRITQNGPAGTAPLPSNYGDIQPVAEVADPNNVEVVLLDGNADQGGIALASESDSYGMPNVISRAGWGADESLRCSSPTIDDQVSAITIHHTAGSNNYTEAQAAAQMRGYYHYHAAQLGWCDIGYQALVDKYGNIYEGRAGGLNKAVQGAHAGGFNQNTWAISMMGDFSTVTPPRETVQAVGEMAGWRASVAGFNPTGSDTHYSEGSGYTMYPYGTAVTLPNIFAHRDVGYTTCPGDAGYAQMDNIRKIAKQKYDAIGGGNAGGSDSGSTPGPTSSTSPAQPSTPAPGGQATNEPATLDQMSSDVFSGMAGGDIDLAGLLAGDTEAITGAAGTIAVIALSLALANGELGSSGGEGATTTAGDVEIIDGVSLAHIPPVVDGLVSLSGDSEMAETWRQIRSLFGPVLGESRSGVAYAADQHGNTNTQYALFDNGIMLSSDQTGTHALWGAIGNAWAGQGFDAGPLGLPVNEEYSAGDLLRVDFQFGYITYDPASGAIDVQLN